MDKSSVVGDGAPGVAHSANMASRRRSNTPDPSATPSSATSSSQTSKQSSANNSIVPSPFASRDSSPARQPRRTASANRISGARPRKNSQTEPSPSRQTRPGITSSNISTRSLSSTTTPTLLPASQTQQQIQAPTPQKPLSSDNLRWPVSPRLRSPPPQFSRPGIPARRSDQELPFINVQRPTPSPHPSEPLQTPSESEAEDPLFQSGMRTPVRGALETVQEVSLPNSPNPTHDAALLEKVKEKLSNSVNHSESVLGDVRTLRARPILANHESGSDSSHNRADQRRTPSVPPPLVSRQSSTVSTKQVKSKQDGSTQSMTVETETVPSVPQVALATGPKIEGVNGTLKTKQSSETIRPKKEKKKTTRKQPAVNSGTASSKADVFEASIASAVDEANTSDSEETFVYDSNPPDNNDRAGRRFHSRTPSATSMVSQADRQNLRSIYGVMEGGGPAHGPKKTMKFVNTFTSNGNDSLTPGDEDGKGSGRSAGGSARGTSRHHHHIGRWGRQPNNSHPSLFDNESPFPNAARTKLTGTNVRNNSSGPPSPRNNHAARGAFGKRTTMQMSSSYDMDDTTGADDERTPLIGSIRSARSGRSRRGPHNLRQAESQTFTRRSSYLNRFAACLVLTMMFMLVITGAIGFMFATSQPMTGIEITAIHNVVTSEQVLMFDLTVKAHNPNIVVVTIDHANLEIFAKSEHAGTDSDWWEHPRGPEELGPLDDPVNDPPLDDPDDDDDSKPNVLLGRITVFDSPLTFEGSLFHQGTSSSTGEMQLEYPGNATSGGSKRWERIYQNEFDLIVKGVVKYTLPMSARVRSATVSGRKTVKPNSANDPNLKPNSTTLDSYH
ncbi:vacuolar segregation subunit 7-domain-containing protein [Ilyonectria robusta]|uniref:vacuolar segregation subunit 7-domain-containing protein n=1 Tax=Ilyonectria robusta TaxID=1079257 RepID=UPI001E8DB742|nr:vacuolar segregation subunit 7-domain-containing protein [Ilyonectria robusta]KAH8699509.1 vacuolar segregation subunit 7-domain-containing protein [Ilyonectria robusta]